MKQRREVKKRVPAKRRKPATGGAAFSGVPEFLPVPVLQLDRAGLVVKGNAEFLRTFGARGTDILGSGWLQYVDAAERDTAGNTVVAAAGAQQPFSLTCRMQTVEKSVRAFELEARPLLARARFTGFLATLSDVTAREHAARRAGEASSSYRGLAEQCEDLFLVVDESDLISQWNPAIAEFVEVPENRAIGAPLGSLIANDELLKAIATVREHRAPTVLSGIAISGHSILFQCKLFPIDGGTGVLFIPDRHSSGTAAYEALRQSEERLRQSEERYRAFIENSPEGIWRLELAEPIKSDVAAPVQVRMLLAHASLAECNERLARFLNCRDAGELLNARLDSIIPVDRPVLEEHLASFVSSGYKLTNLEVMRRTPDDEPRYLVFSLAGTVKHGYLTQVWGVLRDVSERRIAERRLRLLAHALTSTRDAISITDLQNRLLFVNDAFLQTYGYSEDDLLGNDIALIRSPHVLPEVGENIRSATLEGGWYGEVLNRRADGTELPVELWTSVVRNDEGDPVAFVGVARDITERKRTEEHLRSSLEEKEVLLREIHHRVKNNLQVITSLLSLQGEYLKDEEMLKIMRESQHRVRSMALIHEKIYHSHNLAEVDFGDYTRELVSQLVRSYAASRESVQMHIRADSVSLGVDRAIPCGIVVNELVTNALKYAFPGGRTGRIDVELRSVSAGLIRLTVRDDGVGFPAGFDAQNARTLGLTLVSMLAEQLQGELAFPRQESGVEVVLTFRK
jgi:PAS domain S-box-containing protein